MASEHEKPFPPSPDANWQEFIDGFPGFVGAVNGALDCIVMQAHELDAQSGSKKVVAMLTGSLADNLYDILFLCANDRRDGAVRLLWTPYEKYLYAHFIAGHPETAEDFLHFDAVQTQQLMTGLEKHYGYKMSAMGRAGLDQLLDAAKAKLQWNKCSECGSRLRRMWTKVTPEQMAEEADLESIHVLAYRYATLFIHPSWRGIEDQMRDSIKLPSILVIVYKLVLATIKLQCLELGYTERVTGRTAEVLHELVDALRISTKEDHQKPTDES
jgi:hypothetical protein